MDEATSAFGAKPSVEASSSMTGSRGEGNSNRDATFCQAGLDIGALENK